MSFYTELHIHNNEFEDIDISIHKQKILEILKEDGIYEELFEDLVKAFHEGKADFAVHSLYLFELLVKIVPLLPQASFESRGLGEEFFFTWILCVEEGQIIYRNEPWNTPNPFG
ncbi:MAG: hypothetical protein RR569_08185 [Acinetobacter sp.]